MACGGQRLSLSNGRMHIEWYRRWTGRGMVLEIARSGTDQFQTAQPAVIADVMFLHERGAYNTLYFTFYFGSLMVGPIISGAIAYHSDWRNFWWLNVALHGVILILLVFLFPETKWHRSHPSELTAVTQRSFSVEEKATITQIEAPRNAGIDKTTMASDEGKVDLTPVKTADRDPFLHKGRPSKKQFALWQSNAHPFKQLALDLWIPWKIFSFPIVEFAAFVVSWSASSFLTLNLTQSQNFAAPPYNFSSQSIGFMNFAVLVGAIIGLTSNGLLSDWIAARFTRKNRGIREPEMRLPAMIPYVIIMLIGNFVVAFGYERKWDWKVSFIRFLIFMTNIAGHCYCWIHMCWHSGCCVASDNVHLCC